MIDSIIDYFNTIPSLHRALILAGGILFFWIVEGIVPLANFKYNKYRHAGINLFFTATTIIINFAFALVIVKASEWAITNQFGLLQLTTMPSWLMLIGGLLLLDLVGAYFIHFILCSIK